MRKWFSTDSWLFQILGKITDLMILNILFIVSCIPIITAGSASVALETTTKSIVCGDLNYVVREYISSFKKHFRQSLKAWLLIILVGIVFLLDFRAMGFISFAGKDIFTGVLYGLGIMYLFIVPVVFKAIGSEQGVLTLLMKNPVKAVVAAMLTYLPVVCLLSFPQLASVLLAFMVLIGFAATAYLKSYLVEAS